MADSGNFRKLLWLLMMLAACGQPGIRLMGQEPDLLSLSDTTYFIPGDDDWNLVESVIRKNHASLLFLLKRGADPDARAEGGMTALMYAAESNDTTSLKLLILNGADPELCPVEKTTPLIAATLNQHFDVARYLLEKGANPDHQDEYGGSALLYAAALNDYRIADLLLFYGASDSIRDRDGNTALMTAVYFGNLETADVLLQNNLSPDARDKMENTPLMIASQQGNREMVNLLLEYGAGLEKVNMKNQTALAHAILFRQDSTAMILVDSGANVHHKISPNRNLYDVTVQQKQKELSSRLKEKGAAPVPRPDFSELNLAWGNSFQSREHLMQVRFSWVDRKFGFFAETGIDFRPGYRTVQVAQNSSLVYQFREYRWGWVHGAGKYFKVFQDKTGLDYGVYGSIYGMLSFPSYRGISDNPSPEYNLLPAAGLYMKGRIAGLRAGVERYHFGTLHEGAWKMNITIFIRFSNQSKERVYKEIQY